MNRVNSSIRIKRTTLIVSLLIMAILNAQGQETDQSDRNLWQRIKHKAEKTGDRKALWQELKKLPPQKLLTAGKQFCEEEGVQKDPFAHVVTVNAILSYHQEKTSYRKTAEVVSKVIRRIWGQGICEGKGKAMRYSWID